MKKRIISLIMVLVLCFSLLPFAALGAEGEPTIQVESASALPGSTVSVDIKLKDNPGIAAAFMSVAYDSSILTLQSLSYGDAYAADSQMPETLASPVALTWSGLSNVSSDGTFATLTFLVNTSAEDGAKANITLSYAKSDIINIAEQDVDFAIENGGVEIICGLPGDINGDGERNAKDLLRARKYFAKWDVDADPIALDANGDGEINAKDLLRLRKFFAKWDVEIWYGKVSYRASSHALTPVAYKAPSCEEKGNILYYYDQNSGKYYKDANAVEEITLADTILEALGHDPVTDPAVPATATSTGLTEGSHCQREGCGKILVPQEIVPIPVKSHTITYNYASGQPYLTQKLDELIARNDALGNPTSYNEGDEFLIRDLDEIDVGLEALNIGFKFKGWYTASGTRVDHISAEDKQNYILYARWEEEMYSIQYNVFKTPVADITDPSKLSYSTSEGLYSLPNPDVYNCLFLGWYDEDGNEVTSIPAGSTGNRVLNAYFTTTRNYAVGQELCDPIRIVDSDNGVILYAYEIGTIKNVPVSDAIWTVQAVSGLAQKTSETATTSISKTLSQTISDTVAASTQNSNTWSLSSDWTDKLTVDSEWAAEHGMTVEEAKEQAKTQSGTLSITSSKGGSSTTTRNTGTTTLNYDSKNTLDEEGTEYSDNVNGNVEAKIGVKGASLSAGMGFEIGHGKTTKDSTDSHSGSDTTELNTTNKTNGSTWNNSKTNTQTTTDSTRESTTTALSQIIKEELGYSSVRENGGAEGSTTATASTSSTTKNSSNTITYSEQTVETTTKEYSTDGKSEGWYRLVMAADVHVFGVVGYDIACRSYFTYTYSVVDGKTYEFLDYSPDGVFNDDMTNTVLPFEVPIDIYDYCNTLSIETKGLEFDYNNEDHTATVEAYTGDSTEVNVPTYTVDDRGTVYKVTAMTADAFRGKNITKINLSQKITSVPAEAFKDCASLEYVILPNVTSIGSKAFSGCTSLKNFKLGTNITELGDQAFVDCPAVEIKAADEKVAVAAANCGAKNIELDVSAVPTDSPMKLSVSGGDTFYLDGGEKTFTNISMESHAVITSLNSIYFSGCTQPIKLYSPTVNLYKTEVRNSNGFCMILAAEQTALILSGTNVMSCVQDKAILCKNVTVSYSNSGKLNATGDIYHAGTISDPNKRIVFSGTAWDYAAISADEFDLYLQGEITISFDVNGGDELNPASKTAFRKTAIGELPVPTREYYDFDGWFTEIEGGEQVTAVSKFEKDTTVYAHWTAKNLTVSFDANGGNPVTNEKVILLGEAYGEMPTPTREGYDFDGWYTQRSGGEQITAETLVTSVGTATLYAHWSLTEYTVSWQEGTGYSIEVERTESPNADAELGSLSNGGTIYYGDVLSVSYDISTGYLLDSSGATLLTVEGDVTSDDIYVNVTAISYTYDIKYVSSNGTNLGTSSATNLFGSVNTITAPKYTGYDTPSSQDVAWDSTEKTITFTYSPSAVSATTSSGTKQVPSASNKVDYTATFTPKNRTATTVDIEVKWKVNIYGWTDWADVFVAKSGSKTASKVKMNNVGDWSSSGTHTAEKTTTIKGIPVSAQTTKVTVNVRFYEENYSGTDMSSNSSATNWNVDFNVNIPTY